jgi:uncharacterized membrane protein
MTTLRQIEANRRNARLSTGPVTEDGKKRSRRNALRHGLTAETVMDALEDADDYAAFEMAIKVDYEPRTAVERELVLRLASLLWRLRRATAIEDGLFQTRTPHTAVPDDGAKDPSVWRGQERLATRDHLEHPASQTQTHDSGDLVRSFVRLASLPSHPLDRLSRYEVALWRQTRQILLALQRPNRRRRWDDRKFRPWPRAP